MAWNFTNLTGHLVRSHNYYMCITGKILKVIASVVSNLDKSMCAVPSICTRTLWLTSADVSYQMVVLCDIEMSLFHMYNTFECNFTPNHKRQSYIDDPVHEQLKIFYISQWAKMPNLIRKFFLMLHCLDETFWYTNGLHR